MKFIEKILIAAYKEVLLMAKKIQLNPQRDNRNLILMIILIVFMPIIIQEGYILWIISFVLFIIMPMAGGYIVGKKGDADIVHKEIQNKAEREVEKEIAEQENENKENKD